VARHESPLLSVTDKPRLRGVLHLYGFGAWVVAGVALVVVAPAGAARLSVAIFVVAVGGMLGVSALLHRGNWSRDTTRRLLQLDHTMIFLTIAGTYTPIAVLGMSGGWAAFVLVTVWLGAGAGILFEWLPVPAPRGYVTAVYITLGWVAVIIFPDLWIHGGVACCALVALGGVFYTGGAIAHAARRPDPVPGVFGYHELFHACVLAALVCHYAAVAVLLALD
jgi:hemolysin III